MIFSDHKDFTEAERKKLNVLSQLSIQRTRTINLQLKLKKKSGVLNVKQKSQKCTICPNSKNRSNQLYFPHQNLLQLRK